MHRLRAQTRTRKNFHVQESDRLEELFKLGGTERVEPHIHFALGALRIKYIYLKVISLLTINIFKCQ
jgi:hypothetical protein